MSLSYTTTVLQLRFDFCKRLSIRSKYIKNERGLKMKIEVKKAPKIVTHVGCADCSKVKKLVSENPYLKRSLTLYVNAPCLSKVRARRIKAEINAWRVGSELMDLN